MRDLYVLRGVAGCGKSTWLAEMGLLQYTISADALRLLFNSPELNLKGEFVISQKQNKKVWNFIYDILDKRMRNGELIFVDATHSRPSSLSTYKKLCAKHMYNLNVIDFTDIELPVIKYRNANRPQFKRVPEEVIDRMYKECQLPLGKDVKVIKYKDITKEYFAQKSWKDLTENMDKYKKIVVIGDIHSCYTPLQKYFDENPMQDDVAYVFLGDWFDRGIEVKETLQFLSSIYDKPNVILLRGNHELWIDNYVNDGEKATITDAFRKSLSLMGEGKSQLGRIRSKFVDAKLLLYGDYILVMTHGGVPCSPMFATPAMQCIKGVGEYVDSNYVDNEFNENGFYERYYSFHGHRNIKEVPIKNDRVFNLEGQVEFGGNLRIVEVTPNDDKLSFKCIEIKNDVFDKELKRKEFDTNESVVNELENSSLIHNKDFGDGTSSDNFTREAFWDSKWDNLTTTARGLFIDNDTQEIVARSYPKFFAIEERPETQWRNLQKNLSYPVALYRKENGYLGIVSSRNGELYICSKSTNKGDYAGWFKDLLYKSVNDIVAFNKYLADNKVSAIFEVIDIEHDPHIIPYLNSHIVLLDIVKNDFNDTFLTYEELGDVAVKFGLEYKHWICSVDSFDKLQAATDEVNSWDIEGYVAVDAKGFMFKFKTDGYKFWKHIRSIRDKIASSKDVSDLITDKNKVIIEYMKHYLDIEGSEKLQKLSIPELKNISRQLM